MEGFNKSLGKDLSLYNQFSEAILNLVSSIPEANELASDNPVKRAKDIALAASINANMQIRQSHEKMVEL